MAVIRRMDDYRSSVTLFVLVALSLLSLATGARGSMLGSGIRTTVIVVSYPFVATFTWAQNAAASAIGVVVDYQGTQEQVRTLELQIADMQRRMAGHHEIARENERLRALLAFQEQQSRLTLEPARVLQHARGVLSINRGSIHGVREAMCVIAPDGIVGIVTETNPFTSNVATLQSPECKVDAMVQWNRVRGLVQGTGNDLFSFANMHYIDLKEEIREGDIVVTSPDSVFPSGYPVGRIVRGPTVGQLSQSADIAPAVDPYRLDEVFVILNAAPDAETLAGPVAQAPDAESEIAAAMNFRTVQERYAP